MLSAERVLRRRSPICRDRAAESVDGAGGGELLGVDPGDEDGLEEDEELRGYLVLGLSCPTVAMFLTRRMDRAAPQSMKARVAPFHNFILEHGGALKLCGEEQNAQAVTHSLNPLRDRSHMKHAEQCHNNRSRRDHLCQLEVSQPRLFFVLFYRQFTLSDSSVSSFSV